MLGIGLGITSRLRSSVFNPASLFRNGEQGWLYDLYDMSTLFQDAAGTTPVTAVGQPVGLCLDKSKGLVLGPNSAPGGGTFDNATGWTLSGSATVTGGRLIFLGGALGSAQYNVTLSAGTSVIYSIDKTVLGAAGAATVQLRFRFGLFTIIAVTLGGANGPRTTSGLVQIPSACDNIEIFYDGGGSYQYEFDNISVRELPGNHRSQSVSLNRPTYARHPLSGIRNLLTFTEEFDNAAWAKSGTSTIASGTLGQIFRCGATAASQLSSASVSVEAGTSTTMSVFAQPEASNFIILSLVDLTSGSLQRAWFNVSTGQVGASASSGSTVASPVASISGPDASGRYRCTLSATFTNATTTRFALNISNSNNAFDGNASSGVYIWGAQLENGTEATAYQRVGSAFDVTEAGVPDLYYLSYDGLNDSLSTSAFAWGTDKATVVAGVRQLKIIDSTPAVFLELSADRSANNGAFTVVAPSSLATNDRFVFVSKGTLNGTAATNSAAYNAPISAVLSGLGDISGDRATLRVNGTQVAQSTDDQGTGNFGTHAAFFGARAGTSLFFNGREYSNFAINRLLTANELAQIERYTAQRTGVTI